VLLGKRLHDKRKERLWKIYRSTGKKRNRPEVLDVMGTGRNRTMSPQGREEEKTRQAKSARDLKLPCGNLEESVEAADKEGNLDAGGVPAAVLDQPPRWFF